MNIWVSLYCIFSFMCIKCYEPCDEQGCYFVAFYKTTMKARRKLFNFFKTAWMRYQS